MSGSIRVRPWGTRGSLPTPGPHTVRYGGNTSCVEVRIDGRSLVFDAGTGIRPLGDFLIDASRPCEVDVFLSHFHWDHIQGFPFFRPLYQTRATLHVHAPFQSDRSIEQLCERLMDPLHFPVPFDAVTANIEFESMTDGMSVERPGATVTAFRVRHPSYTVGYRIDANGRRIVFVPDCELLGPQEPTDPGWREGVVRTIEGADLLIHDAMFTEEEYPRMQGWGHSTFRQVVDLAVEANVRELMFFHHSPYRTDDELDRILDRARSHLQEREVELEVSAAIEGLEIEL